MITYAKIELNPQDALHFKAFQKHYAFIGMLESLGVFDITNGSAEIHFDHSGNIAKIDVHRHYKPQVV